MAVKFREGQWFAIPLDKGGYALGIVARGHSRTKICLGYFFGDRFEEIPSEEDLRNLRATDAILVTRFGNPGLTTGKWPLIMNGLPFDRDDWPVPKFGRIDIIDREWGWLVEYPNKGKWSNLPLQETRVKSIELMGLPRDRMSGSRAIEVKLDDLLSHKPLHSN
ncbi:MAG: immunity 26/phosphotriesterase HocA family protein [Caldilineaceae bacterium]